MQPRRFWKNETTYLVLVGSGLLVSMLLQPSLLTGILLLLWAGLACLRWQRPQCSVDALVKQVVSVATEAVTPPVDQGCKPDSFDEELPEGQDAVLALIQIDNLEDVLQGLDETQRNAIQSETHQHLMAWCNRFNGFLRKYSEGLYFGVFSRQELGRMIGDKFDILDEIRALRVGNRIPVTLSMGVAANGATMSERGQKAQTDHDLALGRGGDQAVLYVNGDVKFYCGKAKVV